MMKIKSVPFRTSGGASPDRKARSKTRLKFTWRAPRPVKKAKNVVA